MWGQSETRTSPVRTDFWFPPDLGSPPGYWIEVKLNHPHLEFPTEVYSYQVIEGARQLSADPYWYPNVDVGESFGHLNVLKFLIQPARCDAPSRQVFRDQRSSR